MHDPGEAGDSATVPRCHGDTERKTYATYLLIRNFRVCQFLAM